MSLLGVDIGTTGAKALAFNVEGRPLGHAYREYGMREPQPGWAEWDPQCLWESIEAAIGEAGHCAAAMGDPVTALAIACLGLTIVPVDGRGQPTYPFLVAQDARAEAEARWWAETFGAERLSGITGLPLSPLYPIFKITWLKRHRPEVYASTARFLFVHDYACLRLGLPPITDYSLASSSMAFDLRERDWSDQVLAHIALERSQLPQARPAGAVMGAVGREQAAELGLSPKVKVVVGGFDQMAAALGAGVVTPGMAVDSMGTVDCITAALPADADAPGLLAGGHPRHPHLVADQDTTLAYCFSAGSVLRWYRDTFAAQEMTVAARAGLDAYDLVTRQMPHDPSPVMLLPHFLGSGTPTLNPASKGALLGLTLSTTRGDIIKAIMEGDSFEMRTNLESLEQAGVALTEIRAVGGGARSAAWLQLKADILNRRVSTVNVSEGGCLGMAMLAGAATGKYSSLDEAVENLVHVKEEFWPENAELYAHRYAIYRGLYAAIRELSHQL